MSTHDDDGPTLRRPRPSDDEEVTAVSWRAGGRRGARSSSASEPPPQAICPPTPAGLYLAKLPSSRRSSAPPMPPAGAKAPLLGSAPPSSPMPQAWAAWRRSRHTPAASVEVDAEIDVDLDSASVSDRMDVADGASMPPQPLAPPRRETIRPPPPTPCGQRPSQAPTAPSPCAEQLIAAATEQAQATKLALDITPSRMLELYQTWTSSTTYGSEPGPLGPRRRGLRIVVACGCAIAMIVAGLLLAPPPADATAASSSMDGSAASMAAAQRDLGPSIDAATAGLRDWTRRAPALVDAADSERGDAPSQSSGEEAHGTLIVESHGGPCALLVDGRSLGQKRHAIRSLPVGSHVVRCTRQGRSQTRRAIVVRGEITYVGFANGGPKRAPAPLPLDVRF